MRKERDAKENKAPGVVPSMPWRVESVKPLRDYLLDVTFLDKTNGIFDCKPIIFGKNPGVFEQLRDSAAFNNVFVSYGAITWACGLDLAPDAMYEQIRTTSRT